MKTEDNTIEVEMVETAETVNTLSIPAEQQLSIDELENNFKSFIGEMEAANESVSAGIQMDELNEIGDEVIKAKQYLTSFANGEKKSVREQAYGHLTQLPLIGSWAKDKVEEVQVENLKSSGVKEVLDGIFVSFETKKKRLIELTHMADGMRNNLIEQKGKLEEYIAQLDGIIANPANSVERMKAVDMNNQAMSQKAITDDMIDTQLSFILELMGTLHMKLSKTLPVIKNTLNNSLNIAGTVNSMRDAIDMMNALEDLSNEIVRTSTNNIQSLIIDATESLSHGFDKEFYLESAKRNETFHSNLLTARKKHIVKSVDTYKSLKDLDTTNNLLADKRIKEETMLLESQLGLETPTEETPAEIAEVK